VLRQHTTYFIHQVSRVLRCRQRQQQQQQQRPQAVSVGLCIAPSHAKLFVLHAVVVLKQQQGPRHIHMFVSRYLPHVLLRSSLYRPQLCVSPTALM
jgi:hypothetical protein